MRLWILVGCGVLVVAAAIWPWGRKTEQLGTVPVTERVAVKPTPTPTARPEPTKVIEVIDLARAYEPVREPDEPAGAINPASFIQVPEGPQRIPPAIDLSHGVPARIGESATGAWLFGVSVPGPERINVMPREVDVQMRMAQLLNESEDLRQAREEWHRFWMNNQPSVLTYDRLNGVIERAAPVEQLKVMPREVGREKREERERSTGVREDDYIGPVGP